MTTTHESRASLEVSDLTLGYGDKDVIRDLDLAIPPGRMTAIVGPNACSTLR